jgi:Tfp pilus assembly protein PilX
MVPNDKHLKPSMSSKLKNVSKENGAALLIALIVLFLLMAISMSVLAVVSTDISIAVSDLDQKQSFYAAAAGLEKMANDLSDFYAKSSKPTQDDLNKIASAVPAELTGKGFDFQQSLTEDTKTLQSMREKQGIGNDTYPTVTIPVGSRSQYSGLYASVTPYISTAIVHNKFTGATVKLERTINNYLVPLFQFGIFGDGDIELHPGPQFTFNGRVHANGNLYLNGNTTFLSKVTTANEIVTDVLRNGVARTGNVKVQVGNHTVGLTEGSVTNGPNLLPALPVKLGQRGYFPGSPDGLDNNGIGGRINWTIESLKNPVPTPTPDALVNRFGGQVLTYTTGGTKLLLPLQFGNNLPRELIKRQNPAIDQYDPVLSQSRYHSKAQIRILIDDENVSGDASSIPAGKGLNLSAFNPIPLGGGKALNRINDDGSIQETFDWLQGNSDNPTDKAMTVRGIQSSLTVIDGNKIPGGAGITGKILIEIVSANGTTRDVTKEILSLGMTQGEPNGIVYLQRPLWAAFMQGSRDRSGQGNDLNNVVDNMRLAASGQVTSFSIDSDQGYFNATNLEDTSKPPVRFDDAMYDPSTSTYSRWWNEIVPINVYNVREGWNGGVSGINSNEVYERGVMSVIEINMRNLARWLDGAYDTNLLAGTLAESKNIEGLNGYTLYFSDRRGDEVKTERFTVPVDLLDPTKGTINLDRSTTNGIVDNEDIYGPNDLLDPGEDIINSGFDILTGMLKKGSLQKDTNELPSAPGPSLGTVPVNLSERISRATQVTKHSIGYFRRSLRLFHGEDLLLSGASGKLSSSKGITIATENMVYIWGSYNTTGINGQPSGKSTLNDPSQTYHYLGDQIPASIIADAFFPLSRTWFDASSSMYPEGNRPADAGASIGPDQETSVRAGIIAGNNMSALAGLPDAGNSATGESRLSGGVHNFPRFLENWSGKRWNFVGALILMYHSTQALGPYNSGGPIYSPPVRNWAFDDSFKNPNRLPPSTPSFQYIEATGFRQVPGAG